LTAPPQQYVSPPPQQNVWVGIERDGYESASYLAQIQPPAPEQTLRLHRVLVIEPGASLPIRFLVASRAAVTITGGPAAGCGFVPPRQGPSRSGLQAIRPTRSH
jgi:hypothetical protein